MYRRDVPGDWLNDGRGLSSGVLSDGVPAGDLASPCVKRCVLKDGRCEGCRRTLKEIAGWSRMGREEKLGVIVRLNRQL